MNDRLNRILKEYNLTPSRLADQMGIQRSGLSHIMSGRNKPSYDFLTALLGLFPEINANWLLTGKGEMFVSEKRLNEPIKETSIKPGDTPELFTDAHFSSKNIVDIPDKEGMTRKHLSAAEKDNSANIPDKHEINDSEEVEKVILLLKNGKFRSFDKATEKS